MKRKQLSNQELREIGDVIHTQYGISDIFSKKDHIELHEDKEKTIVKDHTPLFFYRNEDIIPTLHLILRNNFLRTVTVDMRAIPFIVSGADIMRPGIIVFDDFKEQDVIAVVDEKNKKPIAIGIALMSSDALKAVDKGKVIKNIHYIGDLIWTKSSTQ